MIVRCPSCGQAHQASESLIGQRVRCTECSHVFIVEEDQSDTPAPASTPPAQAPAQQVAEPAPQPAAPAPAQAPAEPQAGGAATPPPTVTVPHVPARPAPRPAPEPWTPPRTRTSAPLGFLQAVTAKRALKVGRVLLLVGFGLVVLARGWRNAAALYADKCAAQLSDRKAEFEEDCTDEIERKTENLKGPEKFKKTEELEAAQKEARHKKAKGEWRDLERAAKHAADRSRITVARLEWVFVLGALAAVIGLIAVGFYGTGTERTVCLVIIAIITFSLFVGGNAWLGNFRITIGT